MSYELPIMKISKIESKYCIVHDHTLFFPIMNITVSVYALTINSKIEYKQEKFPKRFNNQEYEVNLFMEWIDEQLIINMRILETLSAIGFNLYLRRLLMYRLTLPTFGTRCTKIFSLSRETLSRSVTFEYLLRISTRATFLIDPN